MGIEQTFDSKEAAPEFLRPHLVEENGKYKFSAETAAEVRGLTNSLEHIKKERETAKSEAKALKEKIGDRNLDELLALAVAKEEQDLKSGDATKQFEAKQKAWNASEEKYKGTITEKEASINALNSEIDGMLLNTALIEAIGDTDGISVILLPALRQDGRVKVVRNEDGTRTVAVLNKDGVPEVVDGKGTPFTVKQFIEREFKSKPDWAGGFKTGGAGGSGAPANQNRRIGGADFNGLPAAERLKLARRTGK